MFSNSGRRPTPEPPPAGTDPGSGSPVRCRASTGSPRRCRGVLHDEVIDAVLQPAGPAEDARHAGGVRGDHADGREAHAECGDVLTHAVEPFVGHLTGAGAHVGQNDLRVPADAIEKVVQSGRGVDVSFRRLREVVLEAAAGLVFGIQIEQRGGDALGLRPVARAVMAPVLPTPPLPPIESTTRLGCRGVVIKCACC